MSAYQLDAQELYVADRKFEQQQAPKVQAILDSLLMIGPASFVLDTRHATDWGIFWKVQRAKYNRRSVSNIAARVRRPNFGGRNGLAGLGFYDPHGWGLQFTIRFQRANGVETEYSKIKNRLVDWLFYGHIERAFLRHWMVIDLSVFCENDTKQTVRSEKIDNHDGTYGCAYDVRSFPPEILVEASDTVKLAIEKGVDAVERLPDPTIKKRVLVPAPDLQELVARFGGYNMITDQAWAEWDAHLAEYQRRLRLGQLEVPAEKDTAAA